MVYEQEEWLCKQSMWRLTPCIHSNLLPPTSGPRTGLGAARRRPLLRAAPPPRDDYLDGKPIPLVPFEQFVAVRTGLDCASPLERDFYEKAVSGSAWEHCYYCGEAFSEGGGEITVPGWSWAYPFCDECKGKGRKQPVYRRARIQTEDVRNEAARRRTGASGPWRPPGRRGGRRSAPRAGRSTARAAARRRTTAAARTRGTRRRVGARRAAATWRTRAAASRGGAEEGERGSEWVSRSIWKCGRNGKSKEGMRQWHWSPFCAFLFVDAALPLPFFLSYACPQQGQGRGKGPSRRTGGGSSCMTP